MKFNYPKARTVNVLVNVSILLFLLLMIISFLPILIRSGATTTYIDATGSSTVFSTDHSLAPIDVLIPDTLPYRKYRHLTDSVKQARNMKNGTFSGSSSQAIFIGGTTLERCESCSIFDHGRVKIREHFIKLSWWVLDTAGKIESVKYYVKDGKPYLRKVICKLKEAHKNSEHYDCNEVDVAVPFRYDTSLSKGLLISASERTVSILNGVCLGFGFLLLLFILYYIIGGFIKFLLEIARGTPFSDANVSRLKIIAWSFLLMPVSIFLLNLLMRLVFQQYFTADIKLSSEAWAFLWKGLVLSAIFGALYFAFRKGKELKDEQELTV
jgi:hypothetical protein